MSAPDKNNMEKTHKQGPASDTSRVIADLLCRLERGRDLDAGQTMDMARSMLDGHTDDMQNARMLGLLAAKGETDGELAVLLDAIFQRALRIKPRPGHITIDVCGTGGDMQQTFNISTAAAFIATAAGFNEKCAVAKHGNHSSSGASGSADIFAAIGYDNNAEPARVQEILWKNNICFIFAQKFHPSMRYVAAARKMLKPKRTAFNILGPLANPASVTRQLVGVSSKDMLYRIPRMLSSRGAAVSMSVMSAEGMDELSTSASNMAVIMTNAQSDESARGDTDNNKPLTNEIIIKPEDVGLARSEISQIRVVDAAQSARAVVGAIDGTAQRAITETAVLNAAGALLVAGVSDGMGHAVETCYEAVKGGAASKMLDAFVSDAGCPAMLEEIRRDGA